MKLRIKGNTIRLRLSQSEVEKFELEGLVKDKIDFGTSILTYLIESTSDEKLTADFDFNTIRIGIPEHVKSKWMISSEVGFDAEVALQDNNSLYVLVEKDFQCLVPRKEDESDLFENPLNKTV